MATSHVRRLHELETARPVVELGAHLLEFLEEGALLLTDHTLRNELVQLDRDEAYRLYLTLHASFSGSNGFFPGEP